MVALNEPLGHDEDHRERDNWTPGRGLLRGTIFGLFATLVIILLLAPVAVYFPYVLIMWPLRCAIAFVVAWILFSVVQRAAGMTGIPVTAAVLALVVLVLVSHHVIFAINGVPTRSGSATGMVWLHPLTLFLQNVAPLVAVGLCAAFRHRGDDGLEAILDILKSLPTTIRR
jgi:hypothetical protein